jgi:hypothetical protein
MKNSEAKLSHMGRAVSTLILDRKSNSKNLDKEEAPQITYAAGSKVIRKAMVKKEMKASTV